MVAHGDHLGTLFLGAIMGQFSAVCVRLTYHVADRPPVWRTRSGCRSASRGNPRPAARLLVHEALSGMGQLWTGTCSYLRDLRDLFCPAVRGARDHATGLRTGWRGPAGGPTVGE